MSCSVKGCPKPVHARGCCAGHYKQILKHGKIISNKLERRYDGKVTKNCCVIGCPRPYKCFGYCDTHYRQSLRGEKITEIRHQDGTQGCKIKNCDREHFSQGYCNPHYRQSLNGKVRSEIKEFQEIFIALRNEFSSHHISQ